MMELFVKEMPKSCDACEYLTEACGGKFCRIDNLGDGVFGGGKIVKGKRHKDCPLRPLPKCESGKNQELKEKLAVAEAAGLLICSYIDKASAEFTWNARKKEAAELKAEKGEGNE